MENKIESKKMGKKLGLAAFILTEIIIILAIGISIAGRGDIDYNQIIMYQVFVFITVWGAKASKNYIDKIGAKK